MNKNLVKVAVITGYLGAGKTTLLNHILTNKEGIRAAVIVNDIGEVNIDASLIASSSSVSTVDDSLIPMTNGCICCTLSDDLAEQLNEYANSGDFDYIIIEASGVCEPAPICYTIEQFCQAGEEDDAPMQLDNVIAVVDCARMYDEFAGGEDLLSEDLEEHDIESLLVNQIEFCSTLILNKIDAVTPEQLASLRAIVAGLQQKARIIEADHANVALSDLLNTNLFEFDSTFSGATWVDALEHPENYEDQPAHEHGHEHEHGECCGHDHGHAHGECCEHDHEHGHEHGECCEPAHEHGHEHEHGECCGHDHGHDHGECCDHDHEHGHDHGHHHEHGPGCSCGHCHDGEHDHVAEFGITTFVYQRRRPFDADKFSEMVENWPRNIIRCKGLVWFSYDDDLCVLLEQAGKQIYATENGIWLAAADPEEQQHYLETDEQIRKEWDPEVGDRCIKLVVIGKDLDREEIEALFDGCLA